MTANDLYGYFLHYNPHKGKWVAIPRGKEAAYFNGNTTKEDGIIQEKTIVKLLIKHFNYGKRS